MICAQPPLTDSFPHETKYFNNSTSLLEINNGQVSLYYPGLPRPLNLQEVKCQVLNTVALIKESNDDVVQMLF